MKIVYVYADNKREWNCSEWRCAVPARAINNTKGNEAVMLWIEDFMQTSPEAVEACHDADLIIVQRNLFGPTLAAIQHWKARDRVVIAEFDDAYDLMPPSVGSFDFWKHGIASENGTPLENVRRIEPPPIKQFRWGLRLVHAATTPSKRLVDDWSVYTSIYYVPNYIDLDKYTSVAPVPHEGIHIGWGGSLSHNDSFNHKGVLTALKKVCESRPQVKILINGSNKEIFDMLPVSENQKVLRSWVPYDQWAQELAAYDIGLAPLNGPYDDRRSWIKVLEYMVMKIPWIASEGPAYHELRPYGWLVENSAQTWERVLLDMVDHIDDYRAEAGREAYLYGISQSIDGNIDKVLSIYAEIINKARGIPGNPSVEDHTVKQLRS